MKNSLLSNELFADAKKVKRAADVIKEESEAFRNDLKLLEQCINELLLCWKGEAADSFRRGADTNITEMKKICSVFEKLSGDYDFAANEYAANEQRAIDIVKAIKFL